MAVKNAPATGLLKCRVTSTVTARVVTAATAAPARFTAPPRAKLATSRSPHGRTACEPAPAWTCAWSWTLAWSWLVA